MAVETLNINGISSQGSWSGNLTDVDEAISVADGNSMDSVVDDDPIVFDLSPSLVEDGDTVTGIQVDVRAKKIGGNNDALTIELLIGGVSQGAVNGSSMGTSFANENFTNGGWDVDRSAAEMDGAQIRVTTRTTGMPHDPDIQLDCLDVVVAYDLPAGDTTIVCDVGAFALAGPDTELSKSIPLEADLGVFALAGIDTNTEWGHRLEAVLGNYSLAGPDTGLSRDINLVAALGVFSLDGPDTDLNLGFGLEAILGNYSLVGLDTNTEWGHRLEAALGVYSLVGLDTNTEWGHRLEAALGTYALAGPDTGLTIGGGGVSVPIKFMHLAMGRQ